MQYRTDNVFEAVWVGCTILSINRFMELQIIGNEVKEDHFWFSQTDIKNRAQNICEKSVQSARVGQWTNGDHSNSSYNYLRKNGKLRRLTARGEFMGVKEVPEDLSNKRNHYIFIEGEKKLRISELIDWFMNDYCQIILESSHLSQPVMSKNTHHTCENNLPVCPVNTTVDRDNRNSTDHLNIKGLLEEFLTLIKVGDVEIYNEFSVQFELAMFLRRKLEGQYKIQLERNIGFFNLDKSNFIKKEMDIVIFNESRSEKYCIELKYLVNGQYPEQMFSLCKDIKFLEQLIGADFTKCYALVIVNSSIYYSNKGGGEIYDMFRKDKLIGGKVIKPTGLKDEEFHLANEYRLNWIELAGDSKGLIVCM